MKPMHKVAHMKEKVGFFGDLIEGIVLKFIGGLLGLTPDQMKTLLPIIIAAVQALLKLIGLKEAIKMLSFIAKKPTRFVQVMQQTMAEGK